MTKKVGGGGTNLYETQFSRQLSAKDGLLPSKNQNLDNESLSEANRENEATEAGQPSSEENLQLLAAATGIPIPPHSSAQAGEDKPIHDRKAEEITNKNKAQADFNAAKTEAKKTILKIALTETLLVGGLATGLGAGVGAAIAALVKALGKSGATDAQDPDDAGDPMDPKDQADVAEILDALPADEADALSKDLSDTMKAAGITDSQQQKDFLKEFARQYDTLAESFLGENWQEQLADQSVSPELVQTIESRAIDNTYEMTGLSKEPDIGSEDGDKDDKKEAKNPIVEDGATYGSIAGAAIGLSLIFVRAKSRLRQQKEVKDRIELENLSKKQKLTKDESERLAQKRTEQDLIPSSTKERLKLAVTPGLGIQSQAKQRVLTREAVIQTGKTLEEITEKNQKTPKQ